MKVRVNLTIRDYYDYVGTHPLYPTRKRVISSLPYELEKGYNFKFKKIKRYSQILYRVHISVIIDDISVLSDMTDRYKNYMFKLENISWKILTK